MSDNQSTKLPDSTPDYEARTAAIIAHEREYYLNTRRAQNGLEPPTDDNLVGMCISGGGVRSATLGLGMLQAFIRAGRMRYIDYLSTVSGGGFIGSCLTSLLSNEHAWIDKSGKVANDNRRFDGGMTGVDADNSPFTGLNNEYEYQPLETTRLSARHQLHHLRRFGEYLTPRTKLFSWDVRRAVGALSAGIVVNVSIFVLLVSAAVLLHHGIFGWLSRDAFMDHLRHAEVSINRLNALSGRPPVDTIACLDSLKVHPAWAQLLATEKIQKWQAHRLYLQVDLVWRAVWSERGLCAVFLLIGGVTGWFFLWWSRRFPWKIVQKTEDERKYSVRKDEKGRVTRQEGNLYEREGGDTIDTLVTGQFKLILGISAYFLGPLLSFLVVGWTYNAHSEWYNPYGYMVFLVLPLCFNVGMFISAHVLGSFYYINQAHERVSGRLYRDFLHGVQGSVMLGLMVTALFPLAIILLFGKHALSFELLVSFVPVALAYYITLRGIAGKPGTNSWLNTLLQRIKTPLLNLSIFLFTAFAFAWLSGKLYWLERGLERDWHISYTATAFILFFGASALLVILGFVANTNDLSLHYFFRDRLSEAYLRTDGRVARPKKGDGLPERKDLFDVNLRNHDNLPLREIGEGNNRGPYHLLVAALNLQGSHDLAKKTLKSDHFIFSKYYIGSRTTGYYRTDKYYGGNTRLATAMTISAAAISSGMGAIGFAASNFYMTLLNLRTGYWMLNPAFIVKEQHIRAAKASGKKIRTNLTEKWALWFPRHPFWLGYLAAEFTGFLSANTKRVYVSDGGHTGDNLGLLPLIQRKCRTIYVCDFEEDKDFTFGSFTQAVRLAQAIYEVKFEIDLQELLPQPGKNNFVCSRKSAVKGRIIYADGTEAVLIYMKSSMSLLEAEIPGDGQAITGYNKPASVFVFNYFKNNPTFPHQPTSDQYFDEVQFEAHRMLGEHIGEQALHLAAYEV